MRKEIKKDWVEIPIENILAPNEKGVILGQGWSPQCEKQPSQSENDWGVLKTTAIQSGYFIEEENKLLPSHLEPKTQHEVNKGDLLITCAGPRNRCGVACLVRKTRKKLLISGKMYRFRINEKKAVPEFIELFLLSQEAWKEIDKMKTGGSDSGLNLTHTRFKKLIIPIPPLPEQLAIVAKIEELLSNLENGRQQLQTAQQQLKVYRQSLLKWAFEGKLTNKNVKVGELPKRWKQVQIKEVAEMNPKIPDRENISKQMEVQFLPMKLVEEIINKIHLTEMRRYEDVLKGSYTPFINGDVIFAKVTPCMENGKIAIVDNLKNGIGFGSSEFHVLRAGDKVMSKFIFYYLVQDRFRHEAANEMTGAVGLRRVPKQFIENYSFPLPSLEEQRLIVSELESKLTVCDKIEETISQSLQQAETLRQSILKQAFEGKLVQTEVSTSKKKELA